MYKCKFCINSRPILCYDTIRYICKLELSDTCKCYSNGLDLFKAFDEKLVENNKKLKYNICNKI